MFVKHQSDKTIKAKHFHVLTAIFIRNATNYRFSSEILVRLCFSFYHHQTGHPPLCFCLPKIMLFIRFISFSNVSTNNFVVADQLSPNRLTTAFSENDNKSDGTKESAEWYRKFCVMDADNDNGEVQFFSLLSVNVSCLRLNDNNLIHITCAVFDPYVRARFVQITNQRA